MPEWGAAIRSAIGSSGLRPETEADVIDELSDHLDDRYEELRRSGLSEVEARAAALSELDRERLGDVMASTKREPRPRPVALGAADSTRTTRFTGVVSDVRFGARMLRRNPVFALAAIVTIALAIGANTALYSSLRSLVLKPLPYPDPANLSLVQLEQPRADEARLDTLQNWSFPKFAELRAQQNVFAGIAGFTDQEVVVQDGDNTDRITIEIATPQYFSLLGVRAEVGRLYTEEEDTKPDGAAVLVLSHDTWLSRYGGDRSVVGRTISVNRKPFTIVGVAAPGFRGLGGTATAWAPMAMAPTLVYPEALIERGNHWFAVLGRQRTGSNASDVGRSLAPVFASIQSASGAAVDGAIVAVPLDARRVSPVMRRTMLALSGAALLVLLIACANVANLLIARGTSRQQEMGVRLALGAGRTRIVRQLVAESMVLASAGGALGLALGWLGNRAILAVTPALAGDSMKGLLAVEPARIDGGVLAFTLIAIVLTGLFAGILPAFRATRTDLTGALREGSTGSGRGVSSARARSLLVLVESALAVVLLVGAGLLLRTFAHYRAIDPGVDPAHVLTWRVAPLEGDPLTPTQVTALYRSVAQRVAELPGVTAVTVDRCLPLSNACPSTVATAAGERTFELDVAPAVDLHFVLPSHLDALQVPLRAGRMFTDADRDGTPKVMLLSESAARTLFGSLNPIGRTIKLPTAYLRNDATAEVIGVVGDVRYGAITEAPAPAVYGPALQFTSRGMYVLARTTGDPAVLAAALSGVMRDVAPGVPVTRVMTLEQHLADVLARTRLLAVLLSSFALFAVALAVIGVFGIIAYSVEQRRAEIGVRIALGATPSTVANTVAGHGFAWFAAGVLIGIPSAIGATRILHGLLYDIATTDGLTYGVAIVALLLAGALGAYLPARRAASIDPREALRAQ